MEKRLKYQLNLTDFSSFSIQGINPRNRVRIVFEFLNFVLSSIPQARWSPQSIRINLALLTLFPPRKCLWTIAGFIPRIRPITFFFFCPRDWQSRLHWNFQYRNTGTVQSCQFFLSCRLGYQESWKVSWLIVIIFRPIFYTKLVFYGVPKY